MSAAPAFELLPHAAVPAEAVDAAEHGQVVYPVTRNGWWSATVSGRRIDSQRAQLVP